MGGLLPALFRWRLRHLRARLGDPARSALLLSPWLLHAQVRSPGFTEPPPGVLRMPGTRGVAAAARRLGMPAPGGRGGGAPQIQRVWALHDGQRLLLLAEPLPTLSATARDRLAHTLGRLDVLWQRAKVRASWSLLPAGAPLPVSLGLHGVLLAGTAPSPEHFAERDSLQAPPFDTAGTPLARALLLLPGGDLRHLWRQLESGLSARLLARPEVAAAHWFPQTSDDGVLARACVADGLSFSARVALGRELQVAASRGVRRLKQEAQAPSQAVLRADVLQGGFPRAMRPGGELPEALRRIRERRAQGGLWEVSWPDGTLLARGKKRLHARGRALALIVALGGVLPNVAHLSPEEVQTRLWVRLLSGGFRALLTFRRHGGRPSTRVVARSAVVGAMARAVSRGAGVHVSAAGAGQAAEVRRLQRITHKLAAGRGDTEAVAVADGDRMLLVTRSAVRSYASSRFGVRPRPAWALQAREEWGPPPARGRGVLSCAVTPVDAHTARVLLQDPSGWWFEQTLPIEVVDDWLNDCREVAAAAPLPAVIAVADGRQPSPQRRAETAPVELAVAAHLGGRGVRVSLAKGDAHAERLSLAVAAERLLSAVPVGQPFRVRVRRVEVPAAHGTSALVRLYARSVAWRRLRAHLGRRSGT